MAAPKAILWSTLYYVNDEQWTRIYKALPSSTTPSFSTPIISPSTSSTMFSTSSNNNNNNNSNQS